MTKEQNKKDKITGKESSKKTSADKKQQIEVKKTSKKTTKNTLKVTQLKSSIGRRKYQKETLIGLGLNKLNKTALVEDTSAIRGMITKVEHLIKVEKL